MSELVDMYRERISHFHRVEILSVDTVNEYLKSKSRETSVQNWICELPQNRRSKTLGSEDLAKELQNQMNRGQQSLRIWIGGPDGWTGEDVAALNPGLIWAFGPLTLTHELAAVVATEQIYRAITVIRGLPYHSGH